HVAFGFGEHLCLGAALARLEPRIARAEAEAGEETARLVIDLAAEAPADVEIAIGYIVPGAAWRPYHRATLVRGPDAASPATVEWQTTACVWQATGEDWDGVRLVFSLERPSLGVEPPELTDDELGARRRPDTVIVEAREHEHHTTGLGGEQAGQAAQVPGIDDGGIGVTLTAPRATIAADGAPHRVPVGGFTSAARIDLVAIPVRSPWVHVRARLVNTGAAPLLAGPVDLVMSSGYVGKTEIGFVAPSEKLYLGFGPEADVRIHRAETSARDDAGLLGGWNVQTVRVAVRLSNLGTSRREVVVTERIPISEIEQVEVKTAAPDAYLLGTDDHPGGEEITQVTARAIDDRGLVSWSVELPPLGRRAVTLEYRVRSQRGVAGA
ncbi:MAG TPA: mucoidy inhibitor MuiA family protein, partial [Kofleriaceae bacterium]